MKGSTTGEIQRYLKRLARGRAESTMRAARIRLKRLSKYFPDLKMINYDSYCDWLEFIQEEYSNSTVLQTHAHAKRFLRWANHKVIQEISLIRVKEQLPPIRTYTREQLSQIYEWACRDHPFGWKKRCAIYLLIVGTSGMRASEARHLKWQFWDPHTSTFFLDHTKTGTTRKAMVSKEIAAPLIDEWRIMLEKNDPDYRSKWVIPDLKFPLHPAGYNSIAVKLREVVSVELGFNVNSKTFRSTLVQLMRDTGASFEHIAAVVGHRDIGVTQKYYSRIKLDSNAETAYLKAIKEMVKTYH